MVTIERKLLFQDWMNEVDEAVWRLVQCSVYDLPDQCFADWHDDDMTPNGAARRAIRNVMSMED